jgi:hypothetical protein
MDSRGERSMATGNWQKWLVASIAVGLGSVGAMGAQGCTVTTGDGPYYGTDAAPGTDSAAPVNACNACLFQGCRGQFSVCANAPECIAIYQCAVAPSCVTSGACVQACYDAHPSGQPAYDALVDCDKIGQCSTCQATCGVSAASCTTPAVDAGTDDASTPDAAPPVDACDSCVGTKCATQKQACGPASDCDLYTQCVLACADQACADTCGTNHAAGKTASTALGTCTTGSCATECKL